MPADDLIRLAEGLRAPYGLEKSVKIVPGALLDDRRLVSLHRDAFGPAPLATLTAMAATLGAPAGFERQIKDALAEADVIHLGHEAEGGRVTRKLYFEYAGQARAAMAEGEPVLVHLAYKWTPGRAEAPALTHYRWAPCRDRAEAEARLAAAVPAEAAPRALGVAMRLLTIVATLADTGALPILDVEEPGNARRSCDLNLYDADLRLADVPDLFAAIAHDFSIPAPRMEAVFGRAGRSRLGHLAAGLDRQGREFITVYHGIEGRGSHGA